jgi:hypothetical protein
MSHLKKKADQASEMLWNFLTSDDGQCPKSQSRLYRITFLTVLECNMAKAAFNKEKTLFIMDLNLRKKLVICYS